MNNLSHGIFNVLPKGENSSALGFAILGIVYILFAALVILPFGYKKH